MPCIRFGDAICCYSPCVAIKFKGRTWYDVINDRTVSNSVWNSVNDAVKANEESKCEDFVYEVKDD